MKDDLRYTTPCFDTFPRPLYQDAANLSDSGRAYEELRSYAMLKNSEGLTKTYNRFHDPKEKAPEIRKLRELHSVMDRAVLWAYGWAEAIDATCGFDLDWCDAEAGDDASPDTIERLETGRYFCESAAEAQMFAAELADPGKKLPWRYRWRPESRDDVLARLLLLNKEHAEAERRAGLAPLPVLATDLDLDATEDDDMLDSDSPTDDDNT